MVLMLLCPARRRIFSMSIGLVAISAISMTEPMGACLGDTGYPTPAFDLVEQGFLRDPFLLEVDEDGASLWIASRLFQRR